MKQETLNDRLDRIELAIESLTDKINQIKPADINKKQVIKLVDDLSTQVKSIKPGISEDQVESMLLDLKSGTPKPGISKEQVNSMLSDFKPDTPKPGVSKKEVLELIEQISIQIKSIKSGVSKKDVDDIIIEAISKIKPQERDITKEINDVIERDITRDFITRLYRGAK